MKRFVLLLALCALMTACGDEPSKTVVPDMTPDETPDLVQDETPDLVPDETPDACVGESICPDGVCGTFTNACDEEIRCEPCPCENGLPTVSQCGSCDLGAPTCNANNEFTCVMPQIPGLVANVTGDTCDELFVYVSSEPGPGTPDGTRLNPFDSILRGYKSALGTNGVVGVLVAGERTYDEQIDLSGALSLVGGWTTGWSYDPDLRPTLAPTSALGHGDGVGVMTRNISDPTLLANFIIRSPNGSVPSASSYGILAEQASGLTLSNLLVRAGAGSPGARGADGGDGADGGVGGNAPVAKCDGLQLPPADSGKNPACEMARGGGGGRGLAGQQDAQTGFSSPLGAMGGRAGTVNSPNGADGQRGATGGSGANGPGAQPTQMIPDGGFFQVLGTGVSGLKGVDGAGGGGGGGSYSNTWETFTCRGSAGGSGGAGGCGGGAGQGGAPGGASIGLLLIGGAPTISNSQFFAGVGGSGGDGGRGARGGLGASGGQGNNIKSNEGMTRGADHQGGRGGDGGNGGDGGHGGGGAGGVSFGAWCERAAPIYEGRVEFSEAAPGNAGRGPGEAGAPGLSGKTFSCPTLN